MRHVFNATVATVGLLMILPALAALRKRSAKGSGMRREYNPDAHSDFIVYVGPCSLDPEKLRAPAAIVGVCLLVAGVVGLLLRTGKTCK